MTKSVGPNASPPRLMKPELSTTPVPSTPAAASTATTHVAPRAPTQATHETGFDHSAPSTPRGASTPELEQPAWLADDDAALTQGLHAGLETLLAGVRRIDLRRAQRPTLPSDAASVAKRGELARGEPIAGIEEVVGFPLSYEGLERMYEAALPGTKVFVDGQGARDRASLLIEVSAGNQLVASTNRYLTRGNDGSFDLHAAGTFTQPAFRGLGISARFAKAELELLRSFSSHEDTRISLRAGYGVDPETNAVERVGCYAWGTLGFDFTDEKHGPPVVDYAPRVWGAEEENGKPDLALLREGFETFLDHAAAKEPALRDPGLRADLRDAAKEWRHPWEIAQLDVGLQLKVDVGARESLCHLGKAYLLSFDAPAWYGTRYANRPDAPETRIGEELTERSIARSDEARRTTA